MTRVSRVIDALPARKPASHGSGRPITAEQWRIRELEAQTWQLKSENALPKKASAFFARELT